MTQENIEIYFMINPQVPVSMGTGRDQSHNQTCFTDCAVAHV